MLYRVSVTMVFETDIPVEDDSAGWESTTVGARLEEQKAFWSEDWDLLSDAAFDATESSVDIRIQPVAGAG